MSFLNFRSSARQIMDEMMNDKRRVIGGTAIGALLLMTWIAGQCHAQVSLKPSVWKSKPRTLPAVRLDKERVHVIVINGADPFNASSIVDLHEYIEMQGYRHTYFGQMTQGEFFMKIIRKIRKDDPSARIVLLGYSGGTFVVRNMVNLLGKENVHIDLLIYLGGDLIFDTSYSQPFNAGNIVNIRAHGFFFTGGDLFTGEDLQRASNVYLHEKHIALPRSPQAIHLMMNAINHVAAMK